jgi:hypothetical protein
MAKVRQLKSSLAQNRKSFRFSARISEIVNIGILLDTGYCPPGRLGQTGILDAGY